MHTDDLTDPQDFPFLHTMLLLRIDAPHWDDNPSGLVDSFRSDDLNVCFILKEQGLLSINENIFALTDKGKRQLELVRTYTALMTEGGRG